MQPPTKISQEADQAEFAMLYECIVSGQVPEDDCVLLLRDTAFFTYYKGRRRNEGGRMSTLLLIKPDRD